MRKFAIWLLVVSVSAMTLLGAGAAVAQPQLPRVGYGDNFGMFGDHDFCRGSVNIGLTSPKGKRGVTRVTATSFGFTGDGKGWAKNPRCRVLLMTTHLSANAFYKQTFIPATFGPRRGERVVKDIFTGSGPVQFTIASYARGTAVRSPQSYGTGWVILVP
ncbi:enoyl-CoA hydratase [Gordonia sp. SID5947]|uniref:enoyl-CoA hydratase n=1 Tax=Gordonia sp. SID5947 TaxID=2690315 RepID=UPI00136ADB5B|nr:enoyl-CoA hydratase [Gordonia sp. SID5947]MYR07695.1 enoyl-CoA hydratase [Gordonia sp. SID5947]